MIQLDARDLQHVGVVTQAALGGALVAELRQLQPWQIAFFLGAERCKMRSCELRQGEFSVGVALGGKILEEGYVNGSLASAAFMLARSRMLIVSRKRTIVLHS